MLQRRTNFTIKFNAMKKVVFSIILMITCFSGWLAAQDKVFLRNGSKIEALVTEVDADNIRFKRFENQEGPLYVISKAEVERIDYANGHREEFAKASGQASSYQIEPRLRYGGPRIGLTYLGAGEANDRMNDVFDRIVNPFVTQFGWQFETRFFTLENGSSGLVELIPMIGGLEQGLFIPSITGIVGFRTNKGYELGLGPILSLGGAGVLLAAGTSFKAGKVVFPVNLAFVPSITKSYPETTRQENYFEQSTGTWVTHTITEPAYKKHTGFRITLTIGFNSRTK
jgi:hypothetical protein